MRVRLLPQKQLLAPVDRSNLIRDRPRLTSAQSRLESSRRSIIAMADVTSAKLLLRASVAALVAIADASAERL
jgi:vacuolar-type H+-ATPase subunit E/Vma4